MPGSVHAHEKGGEFEAESARDLGPDSPSRNWREVKMLEMISSMQREMLRLAQAQNQAASSVALIERDMKHLVERFGDRLGQVEGRVAGVEMRLANFEARGVEKMKALEDRLTNMDILDAARVGMARGGWLVWSAIGAAVVTGFGFAAYVLDHLPK